MTFISFDQAEQLKTAGYRKAPEFGDVYVKLDKRYVVTGIKDYFFNTLIMLYGEQYRRVIEVTDKDLEDDFVFLPREGEIDVLAYRQPDLWEKLNEQTASLS